MVERKTLKTAGYIIIVFALVFTLISVVSMFEILSSENWPTTEGVVIEHIVEEKTCASDDTSFVAKILYTYTVKGNEYNSSQIEAGAGYNCYKSRAQAESQSIFTQYPVGMNLTVYYSPINPGNSVLEPGSSRPGWFFPIFTLILWIFSYTLIDERFHFIWEKYLEISDTAQSVIQSGLETGDQILDVIYDDDDN